MQATFFLTISFWIFFNQRSLNQIKIFFIIWKDNVTHSKYFFQTNIELRKDQFLAANPSVSSQELENLLDDIMYRGISPRKRDLNRSNWSFGQSFLFTVTVVTTIGDFTLFRRVHKLQQFECTSTNNLIHYDLSLHSLLLWNIKSYKIRNKLLLLVHTLVFNISLNF